MAVAFIVNGASTFGLRILADRGLAAGYTSDYLMFWYLSGALFLPIVFLPKLRKPSLSDIAVGAGLGLCSVGGQTAMGLAMSKGLPGNVVYPVTLAGGLFLVVACGILFFQEKVGKAGLAGILLGIISIVLLSLD
jgi:multidrug transporter EmrE-like cation transporter